MIQQAVAVAVTLDCCAQHNTAYACLVKQRNSSVSGGGGSGGGGASGGASGSGGGGENGQGERNAAYNGCYRTAARA